jgi:uncharacterized protein YjbI with pentapeptide repeats
MATTPPIPPAPPVPVGPPPASPPPDPDEPLKHEKLELEINQLRQVTSFRNWILQFIQALTPPITTAITLGALIWTIHAGIVQMGQTQNAQDQDRFDKAISRLGSQSVNERLTGVAGLSLFLGKGQESRHAATLRFLASALVIESDPNVRNSILDTFSHIDTTGVDQNARDEGLRTLVEANRSSLHALAVEEIETRMIEEPSERLRAQRQRDDAIHASSRGIVILVQKHTAHRDFSMIDCTDCEFSVPGKSLDLSGAIFDSAVLRRANFSGATLTGASFDEADLSGTNFEGALLQRARFTGTPHKSYTVRQFQNNGSRSEAPNFSCADASRADFAGSLFFGVIESKDRNELIAGFPDLFQTNLDGANLSGIGFYSLHLGGSLRLSPPFKTSKLITYDSTAKRGKYQVLALSETPDWTFLSSFGPFQNSWRYLLARLQTSSNLELARLPAGFANYRNEGAAPPAIGPDANRCAAYARPQGQ